MHGPAPDAPDPVRPDRAGLKKRGARPDAYGRGMDISLKYAPVTVDDVDTTAGQVETLGGKLLHPPTDIPSVGRFCVLQDPQGATLCAITYQQP